MRRVLAVVLALVLACAPAADARRHHHHRLPRCENGTGGIAPSDPSLTMGGVAPPPRCR